MNTVVTSKEAILAGSRALAAQKGFEAISMRAVAAQCGVAVGSVYNYYASKAQLLAATVESIWQDIFHMTSACARPHGYTACVEWMFGCILRGSADYPAFFAQHGAGFAQEEKEAGRAVMQQYFAHMQNGLLEALRTDERVRPGVFSESFTPEQLADYTFFSVLSLLSQGRQNCAALVALLERALY